jgi:hypothetical protein
MVLTSAPLAVFGGDLARFTISGFDTPYPALAAHLSEASTYPDAYGYVTITSTGGNYYMGADYWYSQYYWFSFKVEYGYAIDVDSFQFISKTYVGGPTQYAVEVYADGTFGKLTSGDWVSLPGYGTGVDTEVVANGGGAPLTGLTGYVTVLCWGGGATSGTQR